MEDRESQDAPSLHKSIADLGYTDTSISAWKWSVAMAADCDFLLQIRTFGLGSTPHGKEPTSADAVLFNSHYTTAEFKGAKRESRLLYFLHKPYRDEILHKKAKPAAKASPSTKRSASNANSGRAELKARRAKLIELAYSLEDPVLRNFTLGLDASDPMAFTRDQAIRLVEGHWDQLPVSQEESAKFSERTFLELTSLLPTLARGSVVFRNIRSISELDRAVLTDLRFYDAGRRIRARRSLYRLVIALGVVAAVAYWIA